MTIRNRIFFLNMILMIVAMFLLFGVTTSFIRERLIDYAESEDWLVTIDEEVVKVSEILADVNENTNFDDLEEQLKAMNFKLFIAENNTILFPENIEKEEMEAIYIYQSKRKEGIHSVFGYIFIDRWVTIGDREYYLFSVVSDNKPRTNIMESFNSMAIVYEIIFISLTTILILAGTGWLCTKFTVSKITKPLDLLVDSLKRVGKGEIDFLIESNGDKEFEEAYSAFNSMQLAIQNHKIQSLEYEEQRTDMITSISHDLRTPLTTIKGYIKAVLDGVETSTLNQDELLAIAYDATETMDLLLQKLFLFSKIETGTMPLEKERISLNQYLEEYVAKYSKQYSKEELSLVLVQESSNVEGDFDILQIQRIFDNLIENSLKYAGKLPVEVKILLMEDQQGIDIIFKDNGVGVLEDKIPYIFNRFYRCDEARSKEGNGVGLYIVNYLVKALGGEISAYNDQGFIIRIHFPKGGNLNG